MIQKPQDTVTKETYCKLCNARPCHEALYNRFGTNKRGDITGNLQKAFKKQNGKNLVIHDHPFYLKNKKEIEIIRNAIIKGKKTVREIEILIPDAPEGHHLITCEAVDEEIWFDIFEAFGYDINDPQNGCFFPCDMFVACHYKVPLHQGNHEATFGTDDHMDLVNAINYVEAVSARIDYIKERTYNNESCQELSNLSIKNFNEEMLNHSEKIFEYLKDFVWTLTADGLDYDDGKLGCYNRYRTIRKKRDGMKKENTQSMKGMSRARPASVALAKYLENDGKCNRNHFDDGCISDFNESKWYEECRYNNLDEERFQ